MRRWIWFAGLYLAGIVVIGTIAFMIRAALL
ncbi:MAG: DUF2474 domain-containing protein [Paracoccaceae bacterium]